MSPLAREKEGEKEMIKERRKTARGRQRERKRWREGEGWREEGRREQASALHALKGQMVTAGN